jgi:hypothetical protein
VLVLLAAGDIDQGGEGFAVAVAVVDVVCLGRILVAGLGGGFLGGAGLDAFNGSSPSRRRRSRRPGCSPPRRGASRGCSTPGQRRCRST